MAVKTLLALCVVLTAVVVGGSPANAAELGDSIENVGRNLASVPQLINYASYIIGVALAVAGISKLRAHVDSPTSVPIKDGLGRIGAAAMFVSLPSLLSLAQSTVALDGGTSSFTPIATPSGGF